MAIYESQYKDQPALTLESEVGKGTQFTLRLPLAQPGGDTES